MNERSHVTSFQLGPHEYCCILGCVVLLVVIWTALGFILYPYREVCQLAMEGSLKLTRIATGYGRRALSMIFARSASDDSTKALLPHVQSPTMAEVSTPTTADVHCSKPAILEKYCPIKNNNRSNQKAQQGRKCLLPDVAPHSQDT